MVLKENTIILNEEDIKNYYGFVYITEHINKNKFYIGKKSFANNWRTYLGSGKILKRNINKYGKDSFKRHIVALTTSEEESCKLEIELIRKYNAIKDKNFYNIHEGGLGGNMIAGYSPKEKSNYCKNMSLIIKDKLKDPNYILNISKGVREALSREEVRENMSQGQIRRFKNPKERDKVGKSLKEVWRKSSKEARAKRLSKILEHNQDKKVKEELSKRWSGKNNPKFGTKMSDETKKRLAEARKEKTSKKIFMTNEDGTIEKEFPSRRSALNYLGVTGHSMLLNSMRNNKIYKGYYWSENIK